MLRLMAGVVVLLGCGYSGILFSQKFKRRTQELVELLRIMCELEHNIDFLQIPIADALNSIAKNCETALKFVFLYIAERLQNSPAADMDRIWRRALDKYRYAMSLKDEDIEILLDFSKNLGAGNRDKEKNNIRITSMRLKLAEDEARSEMQQDVKMCRGLGFLFGIFVVVVLI